MSVICLLPFILINKVIALVPEHGFFDFSDLNISFSQVKTRWNQIKQSRIIHISYSKLNNQSMLMNVTEVSRIHPSIVAKQLEKNIIFKTSIIDKCSDEAFIIIPKNVLHFDQWILHKQTRNSSLDTENFIYIGIAAFCVVILIIALSVFLWFTCKTKRSKNRQRKKKTDVIQSKHKTRIEHDVIESKQIIKIEYCQPSILEYTDYKQNAIKFDEFEEHVKDLRLDNTKLSQEFANLCQYAIRQDSLFSISTNISNCIQNNRYADVIPNDQHIVLLNRSWNMFLRNMKPVDVKVEDIPNTYINASYIRRCLYDYQGRAVAATHSLPEFIATQMPESSTVVAFLRLVYYQRSPIILMLNSLNECNQDKCEIYWPTSFGSVLQIDRFSVTLIDQTNQGNFIVRELQINCLDCEKSNEFAALSVTQIEFSSWQDEKATDLNELYDYIKLFESYREKQPITNYVGPTIVHCRAGVGRTGSLICSLILLEKLCQSKESIDVFNTVLAIRLCRQYMVHSKEQLMMLYEFVLYCIEKNKKFFLEQEDKCVYLTNQVLPDVLELEQEGIITPLSITSPSFQTSDQTEPIYANLIQNNNLFPDVKVFNNQFIPTLDEIQNEKNNLLGINALKNSIKSSSESTQEL